MNSEKYKILPELCRKYVPVFREAIEDAKLYGYSGADVVYDSALEEFERAINGTAGDGNGTSM